MFRAGETKEERRAKDRIRKAQKRQLEDEQQRTQRLIEDRERHMRHRHAETEEQRQQRLAQARHHTQQSRQAEIEEQRQQRLAKDRQYTQQSRQAEIEEQRQQRLAQDRHHTQQSRHAESEEQRQQRQAKDRHYTQQSRQAEIEEQRQQRLAKNRQYTQQSRQAEIEEQRQQRLAMDRHQTQQSRQAETEEQRLERQANDRNYHTRQRLQETPGQRADRQLQSRRRKSGGHAVPLAPKRIRIDWYKAAFNYSNNIEYEGDKNLDIGRLGHNICPNCGAKKWPDETNGLCCSAGKVSLPLLQDPPAILRDLTSGVTQYSRHFIGNIRGYNTTFQMTSFGATEIVEAGYMPTFKIQGQCYHLAGSLLHEDGEQAKFLQVYFLGGEEQISRRSEIVPRLRSDILQTLQNLLLENNHLIREFKRTLNQGENIPDLQVVIRADKKPSGEHPRRFNAPSSSEVAILMINQEAGKRDIVLKRRDNVLQRIAETNIAYDALQYPILFWQGEDGYHFQLPQRNPMTNQPHPTKKISCNDFYAFRLMLRENESDHLFRCGDLLNQFVVDMYAKIEAERLRFIRANQVQLRRDSYANLQDAMARDGDITNVGQLTILPSSFTGGPRYMHERTQDAMSYVRHYGRPDLFITFTCNPRWEEIRRELHEGQTPNQRHDLIARVFRQKVVKLLDLITKEKIFGQVRCHMYTVEWQKRGLPHVHLLLWLFDKLHANDIDNVISAELPSPEEDPELHAIILANMVHGPCGPLNRTSPCMQDGRCTKRYPRQFSDETRTGQDGYPLYRRRRPDQGGHEASIKNPSGKVLYTVNNQWIVPYSPLLSKILMAHLNVEICNSVKAIKYICKYINKGSDMAVVGLESKGARNDEVNQFLMARYVSTNEAFWRIYNFPIHDRSPAIIHLAVHLENGQRVYFTEQNAHKLAQEPRETTLTAFFKLCVDDDFSKTLLYPELPRFFTWNNKEWKPRKRGRPHNTYPGVFESDAIGRVYGVHPNNAECFFLRILLHHVRGPTGFEAIKSYEGVTYGTFREACNARGLLENDDHWINTLEEASVSCTATQLRSLFAIMLQVCGISNPNALWEAHKEAMSDDVLYRMQRENSNIKLTYNVIVFNQALLLIEDKVMNLGGKSLETFGLPKTTRETVDVPQEIIRETTYDVVELREFLEENETKLLPEQQTAFDTILCSVHDDAGKIFFLDAPGGTGKTFLIRLLLAQIRSEGDIALAVASSGIAATLLPGGRTAHSAFKLPLDLGKVETVNCNIAKGSAPAELLQRTKLIIWDECTMAHRAGVEALDRTLRDIRGKNIVMGGVTLLLSGDFRQTLPVIPRGTKADELGASLRASPIWNNIEKLHLTVNMRVYLHGNEETGQFANDLLRLGNGQIPHVDGKGSIELPFGQSVNSLHDLQSTVFPGLEHGFPNRKWLAERAILAPKNDAVDAVNRCLTDRMPEESKVYLSRDSTDEDQAVHYPVEFLNSLNPAGLPPHKLTLKIGVPIMLLRNLDPPKLCNGTRLVVKRLHPNVLEATIITGHYEGEDVFIPRIPLIPTDLPFVFRRLQFPIKVCFAMSINKSQGQTLQVIGLNLESPCFSHGQLYVACSRVGHPSGLFVYAPGGKTCNIVHKEILTHS